MRLIRYYLGLRSRLLVVVLMVCAPLVALTLHTAGDERRSKVREWLARAQKMTELASREEQALIGGTRQLLLALAESSPVRAEDPVGTRQLVEDLFASYPRYSNLGVIRNNGQVLASALPFDTSALDEPQQFFQRVFARRSFAIGRYPTNVSKALPFVHFGYPVIDERKQIRSVVFATVDLDWFDRFSSEIPAQLQEGATWTKVDSSGMILSRFPDPAQWIGRRFPHRSVLQEAATTMTGTARSEDERNNVMVHAFSTLPSQIVGLPVLTVLSVPEEQLFAEANHAMMRNLSWLGVAGLMALVLGWAGSNLLVVQPLRSLVRYTARMLSGDDESADAVAPRGRHELGELADNFNRMAEALQKREALTHIRLRNP